LRNILILFMVSQGMKIPLYQRLQAFKMDLKLLKWIKIRVI